MFVARRVFTYDVSVHQKAEKPRWAKNGDESPRISGTQNAGGLNFMFGYFGGWALQL